jgi:probable F420-dependent oxidoreductase
MAQRPIQLSMMLLTFRAEDQGDWSMLRDLILVAESAGVDRIAVSDHVVFGENLEAYSDPTIGGIAGGRQPTGPDGHWLEPFTWAAGFTERVRLATYILIAALRRPVVLAKELATLDVLSGGRVDLGVGVGWQREEYEAAGLDFERRGALLNHTLDVCHTLWTETRATIDDDFVRFEGIHQMPKPLQPGGVPVWVSGTAGGPMLRRLARYGQGWIPWGPAAADLATHIPVVKQALRDAGRPDADELQVVGNLALTVTDDGRFDVAAAVEAAAPLVAAGVTDLRLGWRGAGRSLPDESALRSLTDALHGAL